MNGVNVTALPRARNSRMPRTSVAALVVVVAGALLNAARVFVSNRLP